MLVKLITPQLSREFDNVVSIVVPTTLGDLQILPAHSTLIAELELGEMELLFSDNKLQSIAIYVGFVRVLEDNIVEFITDDIEFIEELDLNSVQAAYEEEEKIASEPIIDEESYIQKVSIANREAFRLRMAKKHHSKKQYR